MRATEHPAAPDFRGSISRRPSILSALFFILVGIVGALPVALSWWQGRIRRVE